MKEELIICTCGSLTEVVLPTNLGTGYSATNPRKLNINMFEDCPALSKITRSDSGTSRGRAVAVPLWGIVLGILCISVLFAALLFQTAVNKKHAPAEQIEIVSPDRAKALFEKAENESKAKYAKLDGLTKLYD